MKPFKILILGIATTTATFNSFAPYVLAATYQHEASTIEMSEDAPALLAGPGVLKVIRSGARWLLINAAGEMVQQIAANTWNNYAQMRRQDRLVADIYQLQLQSYNAYGQPILVNNENVAWVMGQIGARTDEQTFVTTMMHAYWHR